MRILHVITGLDLGGAEMMLYRVIRGSEGGDRSRQEVVSLTERGVIGRRIEQLGVKVHALNMSRLPNPLKVMRLAELIRAARPDVVQTWMYHADLIGGVAARLAGRARVVWGIHNSTLDATTSHRTTRWTVAVCARLSRIVPDAIVSVSAAARDLHVELGYDPRKFVVIPNGFDVREYRSDPEQRRETRRQLGVEDETVLVGLVARVAPQKDHGNFVRAAGLLGRRRRDVRFVLCGGAGVAGGEGATPENRELVRLIEQQGLLDRFLLLGPRDDVPRIMNALDIGTLSSSYGEAFPLVIGEAMACGVPCVVSDVGDSRYLVGDTGRVVPPRDPEALAQAWQDLLELGSAGRRRLGQAARERVESQFSLSRIMAEYTSLYHRLLNGAGGSPAAAAST